MKTLKIIYLNARSLVNKVDHLSILINDHKPDLILITETWCNSTITNAMLNIQGYYIDPSLRSDRTDTANGIGGGLIVYVLEGVLIQPVTVINNFNQFFN